MSVKASKQKRYTTEEYLALEEKAEFRSEYEDGIIIAMAGGSYKHARITNNIDRCLAEKIRKNCESITSEIKVRVESFKKFYYPDVLVICGEPIYYDKRNDTITNPILIVEVMSKSTEAKDRGEKMLAYRSLESLREYVLVSQDNAIVEQYVKQTDGNWLHKATIGLKSNIYLESVEVELSLEEIYKRIEL